jgi:Protein of unknown function (DUF2934)
MPARLQKVTTPAGDPTADEKELRRMIAEAAYYRAEKRGFAPGLESEDWRLAEAEIRARRAAGRKT